MPVRCGHCCIANEGCQSRSDVEIPCPNCLPKWRCLTETFEPSQYSDACPTTHMAKMAYDCELGGWMIVRYPVNPGMPVDVTVVLATRINASDKSECFYQVSLSHPDGDTVTIDVELPDLSTPIEYSIDSGTYTIEIGGKVGICFPLAEDQCSPCKVYTCIPEKLLIEIEYIASVDCVDATIQVLADWVDTFYYGETDVAGETITVVAQPLAASCGFRVSIDGLPEGSVADFDIFLEQTGECAGHSSVANKLQVSEDGFAIVNRGRGAPSCDITTALVYSSFVIVDYEGTEIGSGVIRDGDCIAGSTPPDCPGSCEALSVKQVVNGYCCHPILTASLITGCAELGGLATQLYREECGPTPYQEVADGSMGPTWSDDGSGGNLAACHALYISGQTITGSDSSILGLSPPYPDLMRITYHVYNWRDPKHTAWIAAEVAAGRILPEFVWRVPGWVIGIRLGYVKRECDTNIVNPFRYRLLFDYYTYYGYTSSTDFRTLELYPSAASCSPFYLEYDLPMSWESLFGHPYGDSAYPWEPPPKNSCPGIGTLMKLRITL